jgi:hypothetical protein
MMPEITSPVLSVAALFAEREARRLSEREADEQLKRQREEELAEFKKRLDTFQLTDWHVKTVLDRIKRAFDRGETELMFTSFPSSFCTDGGRAIVNAGAPPINQPDEKDALAKADEPEWLATLPAGARPIYAYWKSNLHPGGFRFSARIINYPGGVPGDVGLFFSWPKDALEAQP